MRSISMAMNIATNEPVGGHTRLRKFVSADVEATTDTLANATEVFEHVTILDKIIGACSDRELPIGSSGN
jgi:hypothetical protein